MEAFKSLKINKAPGFDKINVNMINDIYNHIKEPLIRKLGIFSKKEKLAKVTPIFRSGKKVLLTNYRPRSVLTCFSKIMYNRHYKCLTKNNLLFDKQLGFRGGHSTEHALKLVSRISDSFNENKYTLGVFIDLL